MTCLKVHICWPVFFWWSLWTHREPCGIVSTSLWTHRETTGVVLSLEIDQEPIRIELVYVCVCAGGEGRLGCGFILLCCVLRWYWSRESRVNSWKRLRESILNCWKWMWESSDRHDREEWVESEFVGGNDESSPISWEWVSDLGLNSWKRMSTEGSAGRMRPDYWCSETTWHR